MDPKELRQTANQLSKVAGDLATDYFENERDLARLNEDLTTLRGAQDVCRKLAKSREAKAAQKKPDSPLCLGCKHRTGDESGLGCALNMDTKEACTKRACKRYEAL